MLCVTGTIQIVKNFVSNVDIPLAVGLCLCTLGVNVMTADAIETRVVIVIHNIEERGTYECGRRRILSVENLAKGIDAEVKVA